MESLDERSKEKIEEARAKARPGRIVPSLPSPSALLLELFPSAPPHGHLPPSELKGELGWTRLGYAASFPVAPELVVDNCPRISYLEVIET